MKYRDLIKEIGEGRIASAYLFEGEEDYLKEETLRKLREILIFPGYEDFDCEDFSCRDTSISHLLESVSTFAVNPVFSFSGTNFSFGTKARYKVVFRISSSNNWTTRKRSSYN